MYGESVVLHPILDLGLGQSLNILGRILGVLAANAVHKVQTFGSLEQIFLIAGRIAQSAAGELLDQSSGLGVVLLLADDLLHGLNLLSWMIVGMPEIIHFIVRKSRVNLVKSKLFTKVWTILQFDSPIDGGVCVHNAQIFYGICRFWGLPGKEKCAIIVEMEGKT